MANLPIGPSSGGGPFTVGSGTGLQTGGVYTEDASPGNINRFGQATYIYWGQNDVVAGTPGPTGTAASTGVNPVETSYSLYGHTVPLSVLGLARIGGEIIAGPWVDTEAGTASFCISYGVPADPSGSRILKEIAFDSEVMWTAADGYSNEDHFTFRWYDGTLTQAADPIEIAHFGADAVAYRPQMLLWFENLPLDKTKFKKIPYVAALIADGSGTDVNLGEAFTRLSQSPWVGSTSDQFTTEGITDGLVDGGLLFVEQAEFLATIQQFGRFYRNWDIIQTDKLKIVDHGSRVTADLTIDRTHLTGDIIYSRAEADSTSRTLELSTIDPGADYMIVPSTAGRPLVPVAVSASVRSDAAYLPVVMDAHTRQALVTYTKYQEEVARKKISGTAMMYGLELEPGDIIGLTGLGADFEDEVFKITETTHGVNYTVQFSAESLFDCNRGDVDATVVAHADAAYSTGTSLTYTIPAAVEVGDLLLAGIMHRDVLTPAGGWTLVATQACTQSGGSNYQHTSVYKRITQAGDAGSSTTWTQASSARMGVHILAVRNTGGCDVLTYATASQNDDSSAPNVGTMAEATASANGQIGVAFTSDFFANSGPGILNYTVITASGGWTMSSSDILIGLEGNRLGAAYRSLSGGNITSGTFTADLFDIIIVNGWASVSVIVG